jgi:hypothetical protein
LPPNTTTTTSTINTTPCRNLNNDKLFSSLVLSINNLNQSIQVESLINSTTDTATTNTESNNLRQLVKHGHVQLLNVINIIIQSLLLLCNNPMF